MERVSELEAHVKEAKMSFLLLTEYFIYIYIYIYIKVKVKFTL